MSDEKVKISISSHGSSGPERTNRVQVEGLTPAEGEILCSSMLSGHHWVRCGEDGRLQYKRSLEELPGPVADDAMLPFWRRPTEGEASQADLFGFDDVTKSKLQHMNPSLYITSLCGYHYSPENYRQEAERLTEWGFVCMRSRRDSYSSQFWEVWYLPGVWLAKGQLKEVISQKGISDSQQKLKIALEFIRRNASFGSLDVSMQRIAMVMDD